MSILIAKLPCTGRPLTNCEFMRRSMLRNPFEKLESRRYV